MDGASGIHSIEARKRMSEQIKKEELVFTDISSDTDNAVLGTLEGPCADIIDSTRNGRHYSDSLWEKVFEEGSIPSELIENGGIPGELDHPVDREDTDSARIAILMKEKPKKKKDGKLWAKFDILNTPLGKIAYTLAKAGFNLGISSRGSCDTYIGNDGEEYVDESSYDFKAFDLVLIPAVKDARLHLVTEGVGGFNYKKALAESLNSADEKDRKIMKETLDGLGINIPQPPKIEEQIFNRGRVGEPLTFKDGANVPDDQVEYDKKVTALAENVENPSEEDVNIDATIEDESADNDGESLVEELQTALLKVQELQDKVGSLQEKLSVCYAKEFDYEEEIDRYKKTISKLTESVKSIDPLKKRISTLTEELGSKTSLVESSNAELGEKSEKVKSLAKQNRILRENLADKEKLVESLNSQINSIKSESSTKVSSLNKKYEKLNGELLEAKKDSTIKFKEYSNKLERSNKLVEKYKSIAKTAVNKYMESCADRIGVSVNEIKSKLNESYTFNDIDKVCEEIQDSKLGLNSLPFGMNFNTKTRMRVNESIDTTVPINEDDIVDDTLKALVKSL